MSDAPAEGEVFAKLEKRAGDAVTDLAERACAKFGWGIPTQMARPVPALGRRACPYCLPLRLWESGAAGLAVLFVTVLGPRGRARDRARLSEG